MTNIYHSPISSILNKINCLTSEEIVEDKDWPTIVSSPTLLYELIKKGSFYHFDSLPKNIFSDYSIAVILMGYEKPPVSYIPNHLFTQENFINSVLNNHYSYIQHIPQQYLTNEILVSYCLNHGTNNHVLKFIPKNLLTQECAKILVAKNKHHFEFLPKEFRNDIDVYLSVKKVYRHKVFPYAGKDIKKNPFLVSEILLDKPSLYEIVDDSLKNHHFFLRQLSNIPTLLQYATDDIKNNEHCVWESVKLSPGSLVFASERLLNTPSFAIQISKDMDKSSFAKSFGAWGEHVLSHKDTILELMPKICDAEVVSDISPSLRNDADIMLKVIESDSYWFKELTNPLCCDPQFFITCYNLILEQDKYSGARHKRANGLFEYIHPECLVEPYYLITLYDHFKEIFCQTVYPAISHFQTELIKELKEAHDSSNEHLINYMEKLKLHFALEKSLSERTESHELIKI